MILARFAPRWHRVYVRSHPAWPWVMIGIAISGTLGLVAPQLVHESAPAIAFPEWLFYVFNACWAVGGTLAAVGMVRGCSLIEGPGLSLTGAGLGAYYIAIVYLRASSALTALFIFFLMVACLTRSVHLLVHRYDGEHR